MKYYLIAGEASGDLHGANLIKGLREQDPNAICRAWGGNLMEAQGAEVVKHYRDLAFMGFAEVARNIRTILRNIKFCKADILQYKPDALILIDYPGFNLRIAKWAKSEGIRVIYYISPQIWAWHTSRIHGIKASVDLLFVILPFERAFYAKYGYEVEFVGHPLLDIIEAQPSDPEFIRRNQLDDRPIIALLPGSRKQEISRMLPLFLELAPKFPDYQFVVAGAPAIPTAYYQTFLQKAPQAIRLLNGQTYALLAHAQAALVTSGTATLETALFRVPQVVCYRGNRLSYLIARQVVQVPFISLVNLILNRPLVHELIQDQCTIAEMERALHHILMRENRIQIQEGYQELHQLLGTPGASLRAASRIMQFLKMP